jgi:cyclin B
VTLASAIYFIALKTLEQVNKSLCPEDLLPDISAFTGASEEEILSVGREVLELAKTFSKIYPNLNNLKKFNRF